MPIYRRTGPAQPMQQAPQEQSFWERMGGLSGLGAAGVRGVSGLASGMGGPIGAAISGGGEALAQMIEEGSFSAPFDESGAARIGVEAGLGAVPGGKLVKAGKFIGSALRGGAYAGAGEALREVATEGEIDPFAVGTHALAGGGISGALGRLLGAVKAPERVIIEQGGRPTTTTARTGGRYAPDRTGPTLRRQNPQPVHTDEASFQQWLARNRPEDSPTASPIVMEAENRARLRAQGLDPDVEAARGVPFGLGGPTEPRPSFLRSERARLGEERAARQEADRIAKLAEEEEARAAIAVAREGLTPQQAVSETISAPIPGGRERLVTRYTAPDEEDAGAGVSELGEALGVTSRRGRPRADATRERVAVSEVPQGPLGEVYQEWRNLGRSHQDALDMTAKGLSPRSVEGLPHLRVLEGTTPRVAEPQVPRTPAPEPVLEAPPRTPQAPLQLGTRLQASDPDELEGIEALLTRGIDPETIAGVLSRGPGRAAPRVAAPQASEVPEELAEMLGIPSSPLKLFRSRAGAAGQAYGDIRRAQKAGEQVPEAGVQAARSARVRESEALRPQAPGAVPEAPGGAAPEWVNEGFDFLKRVGGRLPPTGGETGAINPELLQSGAGAIAGGLIGGAADPLGDPLASGFAGAIAGGLAPQAIQLLKRVGASDEALQNVDLSTPERIKIEAIKIAETLPQWQRFNLLADPLGLTANAIVGPYGAALTGAIEAILKGDYRGYDLLRSLNPIDFLNTMRSRPVVDEAMDLIRRGEQGRAEGLQLGVGASPTEIFRSGPGIGMTMGDVTSRQLMQAANFADDEARRMTLTSEPLSQVGRFVAHTGSGETPEGQFDLMKFLWNTQLPFRRTPVNVGEQGLMRTPGLGYFASRLMEPNTTSRDMLVQQAMGAGVGAANYGLGASLSPEEARQVRRFSTNLSGRYSLPAAVGFAAGQATQRGGNPAYVGALEGVGDIVPIPQDLIIQQWLKFLTGEGPVPQGSMPKMLLERINPTAVEGGLRPLQSSGIRRLRY